MSWISDIAGKAENLLNKIDQNAAQVLNEENTNKTANLTEVVVANSNNNDSNCSNGHGPEGHRSGPGPATSPVAAQNVKSKYPVLQKTKDRDEELIRFLNSPSTMNDTSGRGTNSSASSIGRRDSQSSLVESGAELIKGFLSGSSTLTNGHHANRNNDQSGNLGSGDPNLSSENSLLRSEITSLNQEMGQVLVRAKTAEKALLESRNECLRLSRENRGHEKKIQEFEQELIGKQKEKEKVMQNQVDSSIREADHLREKLQEISRELDQQKRQTDKGTVEMRQQMEDLKQDCLRKELNTSETIKGLESEKSRLRALAESEQNQLRTSLRKQEELRSTIKSLKQELSLVHSQHDEYKNKAKKVLMDKESLINSLRSRKTDPDQHQDQEQQLLLDDDLELIQTRHERDLLRDEITQVSDQLSATKHELAETERQLEEQVELAAKFQNEASVAVGEMRLKCEEGEQEISRLREELRYLQDDFTRQKTSFMATLRDRDVELEDVREQVVKSRNGLGEDKIASKVADLETRLQQMGEIVLQKQALLEAVTSEKTSLILQIERLERDRDTTELVFRNHSKNLDSNSFSTTSNTPVFLQVSPLDNTMARSVKKAYSTLDKFSRRIGTTLRRYPMARLFVLAYMTLLHFWVFLILFQATPDPNKR